MLNRKRKHSTPEFAFKKVYDNSIWGNGSRLAPLSGIGSNQSNAEFYVHFVEKLINQLKIDSVVDLGHGDWAMWISYQFHDTYYTGIDVVSELTKNVNQRHGSANRNFINLDVIKDELPIAKLFITKDCLQHLPNWYIEKLLRKIEQFDYILICNDIFTFELEDKTHAVYRLVSLVNRFFPVFTIKLFELLGIKHFNNSEIDFGEFRGIDLEAYPFRKLMQNYLLISKVDFDGPKREGIKKRIYLYKKKSEFDSLMNED